MKKLLVSFLIFLPYNLLANVQDQLHTAILNNSAEEIHHAIVAGADVHVGKNNQSALLWAVLLKKTKAVEELLRHKADPNVIYSGKTLIQYAVEMGDLESASLLLKNGATGHSYGNFIKHYLRQQLNAAITNNSTEQIRRAIQLGADIHFAENEALVSAILLKKSNLVEELIKHGANIHHVYSGKTLIEKALELNDIRSASLLAKGGALMPQDLIETFKSVLSAKCPINQMCEFIQEMIKQGFNINDDHYSKNALFIVLDSYWNKDIASLQLLIQHLVEIGANPNQVIETNEKFPDSSWTPLFKAIFIGGLAGEERAIKIIEALLAAGININQQASPTWRGSQPMLQKPLFFAIQIGQQKLIDFLIQNGATL